MAVVTTVGDGSNTLFWKDRWLNGKSIKDIAPTIYAMVPARIVNKRKVNEAFSNMRWLFDFQGTLTLQLLLKFMDLHQVVDQVELQPRVTDAHLWRLSALGQFSTKSAYTTKFQGATSFEPAERVWRTWAPNKCRFFIWLVEHNWCWTSDKMAKHGMDHPEHCPLCDQQDETISHMLASCVFARQVWTCLLQPVGLLELMPQPHDGLFEDWWRTMSLGVPGLFKKGFNSLVVLGAWVI
jgi:hypothetical protein